MAYFDEKHETYDENIEMTPKQRWNNVKHTYKNKELSKFLIEEYMVIGSAKAMQFKYGVKKAHILLMIRKHIEELAKEDPSFVKLFENKVAYNKKNNHIFRECEFTEEDDDSSMRNSYSNGLPKFHEVELYNLPRVILYDDFLKFILRFDTGFRTSNDLLKLAQENGIEVYDIVNNKKKKIGKL